MFGQRDTCFKVSFFVKKAKNDLGHLLNGLNRTEFENLENAEIQKSVWEMAVFDLQNTKTRSCFTVADWNFVHIYTHQGFPHTF